MKRNPASPIDIGDRAALVAKCFDNLVRWQLAVAWSRLQLAVAEAKLFWSIVELRALGIGLGLIARRLGSASASGARLSPAEQLRLANRLRQSLWRGNVTTRNRFFLAASSRSPSEVLCLSSEVDQMGTLKRVTKTTIEEIFVPDCSEPSCMPRLNDEPGDDVEDSAEETSPAAPDSPPNQKSASGGETPGGAEKDAPAGRKRRGGSKENKG